MWLTSRLAHGHVAASACIWLLYPRAILRPTHFNGLGTDTVSMQGSSSLLGPQGEGAAHQDNWPPWCSYGHAREAGWPQVDTPGPCDRGQSRCGRPLCNSVSAMQRICATALAKPCTTPLRPLSGVDGVDEETQSATKHAPAIVTKGSARRLKLPYAGVPCSPCSDFLHRLSDRCTPCKL